MSISWGGREGGRTLNGSETPLACLEGCPLARVEGGRTLKPYLPYLCNVANNRGVFKLCQSVFILRVVDIAKMKDCSHYTPETLCVCVWGGALKIQAPKYFEG